MNVFVYNVEGEYRVPEGYTSWLNWWEDNGNFDATRCMCDDCDRTEDLVGGHVYRDGFPDDIYVVPLCKTHNHYRYVGRIMVDDANMVKVPESLLVRNE